MRRSSLIWLFIPIVTGIPVTFYAASLYVQHKFATLPVYGKEQLINGEKTAHNIAPFKLTNQQGKISGSESWNNKIVVADFFFTHCAAVCPRMTASLKLVQQAFSKDELQIASISVDPERDSVARLRWYQEKFSIDPANWELLTGNKKDIYKMARNSFMVVATDGDGGSADFIHSENLILIDKQKRILGSSFDSRATLDDIIIIRLFHQV